MLVCDYCALPVETVPGYPETMICPRTRRPTHTMRIVADDDRLPRETDA